MIDQKINTIIQNINQLKSFDKQRLLIYPNGFNHPQKIPQEYYSELYNKILTFLENKEIDFWKSCSFNQLNAFESHFKNTISYAQQLIGTPANSNHNTLQQRYQHFYNGLESLWSTIVNQGLIFQQEISEDLTSRIQILDNIKAEAEAKRVEFDQVLKNLIEIGKIGTSGTLSESFHSRQVVVKKYKDKWECYSKISSFLGFIVILIFLIFPSETGRLFCKWDFLKICKNPIEANLTIKTESSNQTSLWIQAEPRLSTKNGEENNFKKQKEDLSIADSIKRIVIVSIPLSFIYFCFSQYRRERSLEEEYAHREAVAKILNTYHDQILLDENKDKLSLLASDILFRVPAVSPEESKIKGIKEILDVTNRVKGSGNS